jgi:nucleoside-diphosphate-sugar epimerase
MMRVLVTGASGFIGRHVVKCLESYQIDHVTIGRFNDLDRKNHVNFDLLTNSDYSSLFSATKPTHLIHLAWYTEHGKYWTSPLNIKWAANTHSLIESFYVNGGQHAVISGTCAEYDWGHGYCVEGVTPLQPKTLYGVSKAATQQYCNFLKVEHSKSLTWARLFFPYGSDEGISRLIPSLFNVFQFGAPSFGVNAKSYRDFLHVDDVANALTLCTIHNIDDTLNISSGNPTSIESVVNQIASLFKSDPNIILRLKSERLGEPHLLVGDNQKLRSIGWSQKIGLEQGLTSYLSKHQKYPNDTLRNV